MNHLHESNAGCQFCSEEISVAERGGVWERGIDLAEEQGNALSTRSGEKKICVPARALVEASGPSSCSIVPKSLTFTSPTLFLFEKIRQSEIKEKRR